LATCGRHIRFSRDACTATSTSPRTNARQPRKFSKETCAGGDSLRFAHSIK
jgi:hypothetical protein